MIFGIDIDIANLIVQAFIGLVTLVALIVAFWQGSQSKRNREDDIKRYQPSRISAWYEGGRNRTGQPEDNRFVWQFVVLRNESESPVYDAIVTCVGISGAGPSFKGEDNRPVFPNRVCVGTLPPGAWYIWLPTEGHGMGVRTAPRNGFHRRKRNIVGSARQRKARGDSYGAGLVLQAVPPLALARMRKADRVAPWHRRFKHWVFRTETRPSPAVPDNGKVRNTRVYGAGSRGRLRPIFPMHP